VLGEKNTDKAGAAEDYCIIQLSGLVLWLWPEFVRYSMKEADVY